MLSKEQSAYLWATSWCSLISSLYGLYHYRWIAILPWFVFCSSINYWRNPISHSPRRYADIATVFACITTQVYWSQHKENFVPYLQITIIGISFYPIARILSYNGLIWPSVIVHSMLHITGNIANVVLHHYRFQPRTKCMVEICKWVAL